MVLSKIIYNTSFYLGNACLGLKEVRDNGRILYRHGDLVKGKVKFLHPLEYQSLQCIQSQQISRLFIFRQHTFRAESTNLISRVQIVPSVSEPTSLLRLYIQGCLYRIVKAVTLFVIALLTSPLSGLVLIGAYLHHPEKVTEQISLGWQKGSFQLPIQLVAPPPWNWDIPQAPVDSHFTRNDILKIGDALIGYRHVSTEKEAQQNAGEGIEGGCSLCIAFCGDGGLQGEEQRLFEGLNRKILSGENCDDLMKKYEDGITQFITSSFSMDVDGNASTYGKVFNSLESTRFMVVRTHWLWALDSHGWGKLGRFAKEDIDPTGVILLPRLKREELKISMDWDDKRFACDDERIALRTYLVSLYRRELLRYIRNDFSPEFFNQIFRLPFSQREAV